MDAKNAKKGGFVALRAKREKDGTAKNTKDTKKGGGWSLGTAELRRHGDAATRGKGGGNSKRHYPCP